MIDDPVKTIITLLRLSRADLSSEKDLQRDIESLFKSNLPKFDREFRLNNADIIDFFVDGVGIEVKLHGSNKQAIYRQLCRYAKHDAIQCLILVTNMSMGLPLTIEGKPAFYVNMSEGWM